MKRKRFLKVWMFYFVCIAIFSLVYSPAFGQISQDISLGYLTPLGYDTLDSSLYMSPLLQTSSYASTITNPFAAVANQATYYGDLLSTAVNQSFSYQNIFGFGYSTGYEGYNDPFYTSQGGYSNLSAPGAMLSREYDYSQSMLGGSTHTENTLILPWTTYSAEINTAYGMEAYPFATAYTGSSLSMGTPTVYSLAGRGAEGIYNLMAYAPISTQLDRSLGDQPMYTAEGMPFYAAASYFNPYSGSNWFFAPGTKIQSGGVGPGYTASNSLVTGGPILGGRFGFSGGGGSVVGGGGITVSGGGLGGGLGGLFTGGMGGGMGIGLTISGTGSPAAFAL